MKTHMQYLWLVGLVLSLSGSLGFAQGTNRYPALIGRVSDHAHVLSSNQVEQLTAILSAYEKRTTTQIAVFTVESIRPATNIAVYGTALANHYGIGTREKNNGIVFLVATKDREMRLAVGLGLEKAIPDSVAATIINDRVRPLFKQGRMYDGIVVCVQAVIGCLDQSTSNIPSK